MCIRDSAYLAALGSQAGEDFAGVEMLYLNPTPRLAAFALMRTFVWPWDSVPLASAVLVVAALGAVVLLVRERRTALAVAAIALPYLAFHLAFQDTVFSRYALPLVLPVAFLAAVAFEAAGRAGAVAAVALAVWSLSIAVPQQRARQPPTGAIGQYQHQQRRCDPERLRAEADGESGQQRAEYDHAT